MEIVTGSKMTSLGALDQLSVGRKQGLEYLLEIAKSRADREIAEHPRLTVVQGPLVRVSVEYYLEEE